MVISNWVERKLEDRKTKREQMLIAQGREEGIEQGRKEGREEGRKEGIEIGRAYERERIANGKDPDDSPSDNDC